MADGTVQNGTAIVAGDEITTENGTTVTARQAQRVKIDSVGTDGAHRDTSDTFPFPTKTMDNGLVSTVNSTSANLGAGASFTGTSEDLTHYSSISVAVFSSHISATDGLSIQQSSDGTNWDIIDSYSIPAVTGKVFNLAVSAKYFRLGYTNGATTTTSLRIQTIFHKSAKKGSSVRPQDARTNDNDLEEVATYLHFFNGTSWDRARGSIAGGLSVSNIDSSNSGTITAINTSVALSLDGDGAVAIQISGTWVGTIQFEGTIDGITWYPINAVRAGSSTVPQNTNINGLHRLTPAGLAQVRVTAIAWTSGTATINIRSTLGTGGIFANQIIPVTNGKEINSTFRGRSQTFRIPGLAGTAGQKLFALHNATASTKIVHINQLTVDLMMTAAKVQTVAPPIIRVHRFTAIPTGGAACTKVSKDTALTSNASVTAWQGASADGTGVSLTVTIPAGNMLTQEFAPRVIQATAASIAYEPFDRTTLLEDAGIVLRPLEGIVVNLDYVLATQNPITDMWIVGCDWYEL